MVKTTPVIFGLVLAGGQSTRMGEDKSLIPIDGYSLRDRAHALLASVCKQAFISCRAEQVAGGQCAAGERADRYIFDQKLGAGPAAGLLSAHETYPEVAWLTLACDLPHMSVEVLHLLLEARNAEVGITVFQQANTLQYEPLVAIWEPRGLQHLKANVAAGRLSLLESIDRTPVHSLAIPTHLQSTFLNCNTRQDLHKALQIDTL